MYLRSAFHALCVIIPLTAPSALLVYDGFDYAPATEVSGQNGGIGWSSFWNLTGGSASIVSGFDSSSLNNGAFSTAGLAPSGGSLENDHNVNAVQRSFSTTIDLDVDGAVYFSYLIRMSEVANFDDLTFTGTASSSPFEVRLGSEVAATGGSSTFKTDFVTALNAAPPLSRPTERSSLNHSTNLLKRTFI